MLSGVWTCVVLNWNGCCLELERILFLELERMLSGVGTYLFRSLAVSRGVRLEYHYYEHSK